MPQCFTDLLHTSLLRNDCKGGREENSDCPTKRDASKGISRIGRAISEKILKKAEGAEALNCHSPSPQQSGGRGWNWKVIHARLKLKSCEGERQIEALRFLANSYKHDPSKKPDEDLLRLLNLETDVTYAPLPESDGLQEGLALFIGLEKDADYCDITETFMTIIGRFIEDVQKKTQLSRVRWGGASLTDFAR